jgi:hypothetical protein
MAIIDMNGHEIEVTDLPLALMQADDYRHYRLTNPTILSQKLQAYWEDLYQKLLRLDEELNG